MKCPCLSPWLHAKRNSWLLLGRSLPRLSSLVLPCQHSAWRQVGSLNPILLPVPVAGAGRRANPTSSCAHAAPCQAMPTQAGSAPKWARTAPPLTSARLHLSSYACQRTAGLLWLHVCNHLKKTSRLAYSADYKEWFTKCGFLPDQPVPLYLCDWRSQLIRSFLVQPRGLQQQHQPRPVQYCKSPATFLSRTLEGVGVWCVQFHNTYQIFLA